MKVSFVLLAAVLAFTASAAPLDRRSRPATTADLANVDAAPAVGSPVYAREATPEVYVELSKRQDSNALKNLVVNYLQQNKTPQIIIDLIKTAPDAVVAKIMKLPPKDLQTVVDQLKSGKIPTIPGITPKELVVGFLTPLNIPATTMGYIKDAPDSMFERITNLPLAQLEAVINDLKGGRIPTIAGVTDGLPGVGATTPGASAPAPIAPVASTPVVTPPVVSAPAPIAPIASAAAPIAPIAVAQPSGDSGLASPARPKAKRQAATTPITPAAGTNPVGTAPNPNAQAAAPAVDFPTSGAQFQQLMVSDMTNGGADPKQIAFIKTVPTATFDKILALEKQAGGQVASAPAMPAANTPMGSTPVGTAQPVTAGDSGLASPAAPKRQ
ncbi:hypothetical protein ABW20_dc0105602 [Dactylellina cionopaga]|nr:hypothetical protein ABW20_dc0105602 [Dactylellina cionopaga]